MSVGQGDEFWEIKQEINKCQYGLNSRMEIMRQSLFENKNEGPERKFAISSQSHGRKWNYAPGKSL